MSRGFRGLKVICRLWAAVNFLSWGRGFLCYLPQGADKSPSPFPYRHRYAHLANSALPLRLPGARGPGWECQVGGYNPDVSVPPGTPHQL